MNAFPPGRFRWLWIPAAAVLAITLVVAIGATNGRPVKEDPWTVEAWPAEATPGLAAASRAPDSLVVGAASARPTMPPTPTPLRIPEWVVTRDAVFLRAEGGESGQELQLLPEGTVVKVLGPQEDGWHVYYGGDGEDHQPQEGWVAAAFVSPSGAPGWVATLRGAQLRSATDPGASVMASLPRQTVLEVLEDRGSMLRVRYQGDGRGPDLPEGWIQASDLGGAGGAAAGARRGVKLLTPADAAELRSSGGYWLKVPYRSQLDGSPSASANCGPASVGMALERFGVAVPTAQLRQVADRLQGTSNPEGGFAIQFLQKTVQTEGLRAEDLYVGRDFKRWTLDDVRRQLSLGHPVIPELRFRFMPGRTESEYAEDHYVVLSGVWGDNFVYNDGVDSDGPGYARVMDGETLMKAWGGSFFPLVAFAVSKP